MVPWPFDGLWLLPIAPLSAGANLQVWVVSEAAECCRSRLCMISRALRIPRGADHDRDDDIGQGG